MVLSIIPTVFNSFVNTQNLDPYTDIGIAITLQNFSKVYVWHLPSNACFIVPQKCSGLFSFTST
jgi:hypothetical protein